MCPVFWFLQTPEHERRCTNTLTTMLFIAGANMGTSAAIVVRGSSWMCLLTVKTLSLMFL